MSASNPRMDASPTCARSGVNPLPLLESLEQRLLLTTVSLALSTTEITEIGGVPAVFTVSRDNTVGDLTVKYRVGGSEPAGKIAETLSGTLVIPNGASSATISATPMNDGAAGNNNTLTIQLLDPDGNGYSLGTVSQGTVRIDESTSLLGTYITVGPGKMYADPWTAIRNASAGVTIDVWPSASGQYTMPTGDSSLGKVNYSNVTIRGIGEGRVKMFSNPATQLANQKGIIIFQGGQTNFTMENLDLEGARYGTPGYGNGAGLRGQGDNYTVRNCLFANNEDGILSDGSGASNILIEYSEFNNNGAGDGQSHNLYIGTGANVLTFQYNHDIGANEGHLLKSRAKTSYVLYNFFQGGLTESYELSMPDSGKAYVIGNVIRQAPTTHNSIIFDYASETAPRVGDFLYVVGNTIINSAGGGTFIQGTKMAAGFGVTIKDNILAGPGTPWSLGGATPTTAGNVINGSIAALNFVNYAAYDYHLLSTSPAIGAGVAPGSSSDGYSLAPTQEYVRENGVKSRPTGSPYDAGAYDYLSDTTAPTVTNVAVNDALLSDGDVGNGKFTVTLTYSEAMGSSPAPTITFTPAVASSLSFASGSWTDTTHYAAVYNVADANVAVANIGIGVTGGQDSAGNSQTAYSGSNNFGIDTLNPAAPIITGITTDTGVSSTDGITSDQTLSISGTAEANSTVTVTRGGTGVIGTAAANGSGAWSFDYTGTSLVQGSYNFTAKAKDAAGNVSGISATYAVVVDLTAPTSSASVDHCEITLSAVDTGGSGVGSLHVQVNGGVWTTYAGGGNVLVGLPAGESVSYYAQDVAGNVETTHSLTIPLVGGDANRDGYVDVIDMGILAMHYDTATGATWSMGDFNGDGAVDVIDLGKLAMNYDCGATGASAASTPSGGVSALSAPTKSAVLLAVAPAPATTTAAAMMDVESALDSVPAIGTVKGKRAARVRRLPRVAHQYGLTPPSATAGSL